MEKEQLIITNNNNCLSVKCSGKVIIRKSIYIAGTNTELNIDCIADFSKIPEQYHQIYYDAFVATYYIKENKIKDKPKEKINIDKIVDFISNLFK
jgi:hypothetical protein